MRSHFFFSLPYPQLEIIQIFINWWIDKQNLVHLYNRILLNNNKGLTTDTCMDKSQKHYVEQKMSGTKQKFSPMPFLQNFRKSTVNSDGKQTSGCLGQGAKGVLTAERQEGTFWHNRKIFYFFLCKLQECINLLKPIKLYT